MHNKLVKTKHWAPLRRLGLFRQLVLAFLMTTFVVGIGLQLSSRAAFRSLEVALRQDPPAQAVLWLDRLAGYYESRGTWDGVDAMVASYPLGESWAPWDSAWDRAAVITDSDGTILVAPDAARVGEALRSIEREWALPIEQDGRTIGYLLMPVVPFDNGIESGLSGRFDFIRLALKRFLVTQAVIVFAGLALGALLSRRISRPLSGITTATQAVAAGDLSARVPEGHPGELGELARSFNAMAEALERADLLRRNLTADVAHELRTPLSVIRGKLEGILDGVYPATEAHLAPILEETTVLTHLVEDLRLLALAEARQLTLERSALDVADALRDAGVNFGPQAGDRGVTLTVEVADGLPQVSADWRRVSQVLGNLIANALRYTPEGGTVTLAAYQGVASGGDSGPFVTLEVRDTGVGIPPEDLPFVFERFWRGEKSRARSGGGSGLGLAIARELVALHGGELTAESSPGHGATFRFTLPVVGEF